MNLWLKVRVLLPAIGSTPSLELISQSVYAQHRSGMHSSTGPSSTAALQTTWSYFKFRIWRSCTAAGIASWAAWFLSTSPTYKTSSPPSLRDRRAGSS